EKQCHLTESLTHHCQYVQQSSYQDKEATHTRLRMLKLLKGKLKGLMNLGLLVGGVRVPGLDTKTFELENVAVTDIPPLPPISSYTTNPSLNLGPVLGDFQVLIQFVPAGGRVQVPEPGYESVFQNGSNEETSHHCLLFRLTLRGCDEGMWCKRIEGFAYIPLIRRQNCALPPD
ncbi:hypothetical protein CEXT_21741, partial [Caerostris extrusa]